MTPGAAAPAALLAAGVVLGAAVGWLLGILAGRFLRTADRLPLSLRIVATGSGAALFPAVLQRFGLAPEVVAYLLLAVVGILLAVVDLREKRLPDVVVLPAAAGLALVLAVCSALRGSPLPVLAAVAGGAALFAVYLLQLWLVPRGMLGGGDVKLALILGAATGYLGLRAWLIGLVAAYFVNLVPLLVLLLLRRATLKTSVPFGPAMIAGAFLAILLA